jgi:hypothetical protein
MLFITNFLLFTIFFKSGYRNKRISENVIIFFCYYLLTAEIFSFFDVFDVKHLLSLNIGNFFILLFLYHQKIFLSIISKSQKFKNNLSFIFFGLMFLSAIFYFPSNYDSNTYHLPRIISWLQGGSLSHYPTTIYRQVYQPYLNEIFLANIYSTYGPISLVNLWSFILLIYIYNILIQININIPEKYRLNKDNIWIFLLLCFSILLSSVNTKNDIQSLYLLLIMIQAIQRFFLDQKNFLLLGSASVILGYLTKGTFQIHAFSVFIVIIVICLVYGFRVRFYTFGDFLDNLRKNIFPLIFLLLMLLPSMGRNLYLTNNLTGQSAEEIGFYVNSNFKISSAFSNSFKNFQMHSTLPIIGSPLKEIEMEKFGKLLNLPTINDPGLNWMGGKYNLTRSNAKGFFSGDTVPNYSIYYLTLVILVFGLLFLKKIVYFRVLFIFLLAFIQLFVFSFLLKWQPWHTRLLFPVFLTLSYGIIFALEKTRFFHVVKYILIVNATIVICFNSQQPLISYSKLTRSYPNIWSKEFYHSDLFNRRPSWEEKDFHYNEFQKKIGYSRNIGLICDGDDKVFGYMADYRKTECSYNYLNINNNPTGKIKIKLKPLDFIILNKKSQYWSQNKAGYLESFSYYSDTLSQWILLKSKT